MPGFQYRHRGVGRRQGRAALARNAWRIYGPLAKKMALQVAGATDVLTKPFRKKAGTKPARASHSGARKKKRFRRGARAAAAVKKTRVPRSVSEKVTSKHLKQYPQTLAQTYYITSKESYTQLVALTDGTITNPDMLYSPSSLSWKNASIMMFNIHNTEAHWTPITALPVEGFRTGTQLCGNSGGAPGVLGAPNTSFIWENNAANTDLVSRQCPFKQNGLAENAVGATARYTTPNSLLTGVNWNLKVCNPTIQAQMLSVKLIRYSDGADGNLVPGQLGDDATEVGSLINTMCNARAWTDPQKFSTIYTKTYRLPGIRPGNRIFMHDISGKCTLAYLRSQFRKQYNANEMATLGTQAKPTFMLTEDGKFFNSCFLVVSSTCVDDQYIADMTIEKGTGVAGSEYFERMPQLCTYPPVGAPATVGNGKYQTVAAGAQFGIQGTVSVFHRVQAIRRAIGSATAAALADLQDQLSLLSSNGVAKPKSSRKSVKVLLTDGSESDTE